jgi:hypothetical protein
MRDLSSYEREMGLMQEEASKNEADGSWWIWVVLAAGTIFTSVMSFALVHRGLIDAAVGNSWVSLASFAAVVLMEGSGLATVYGRQYWFRSREQRRFANIFSWCIYLVLGLSSLAKFSMIGYTVPFLTSILSFYATFGLPAAIIAIILCWKHIYDMSPRSQIRVETLEMESEMKSRLIQINRRQNRFLLDAYDAALESEPVLERRKEAFEQFAMKHCEYITQFIPEQKQLEPAEEAVQGEVVSE